MKRGCVKIVTSSFFLYIADGKAFRLIGFCLCLLDSANFFRVRDTPFGSGVCGCANLIKSAIKIAVKVGSGDNYACLSLFGGKMSLFDTW